MGSNKYMLPAGSAIEWDDVFRLAGNNCIGRKKYQPYVNANTDPGHCLEDLINDFLDPDNYVMANRYEFQMTEQEFNQVVDTLARDIAERRGKPDEPVKYWRMVVGNCRRLMQEAMVEE